MSATSAIFDLLVGDAEIASVVGKNIFPSGQAKEGASPPFLIQETISADRPPLLSGICPLKNYQIRLTGICSSEVQLRKLMDAVEERLDGTKTGVIRGCQKVDENTEPNPDWPTEHSESMTFSVWYARSNLGANN